MSLSAGLAQLVEHGEDALARRRLVEDLEAGDLVEDAARVLAQRCRIDNASGAP